MPQRTRKELTASLRKGDFAPAYYLFGSEDVLKEEFARTITDRAVDPGLRDFNFDQRSAASLDPDAVESLCNTLPMMAERRVVIIRDVEAWKRKPRARAVLVRYLEQPSPETVVILLQGSGEEAADKELSRLALAVECDTLTPGEALKWVATRAAAAGITFEAGAAEHLLKSIGPDLGLLRLELEKLSALPEGEAITVDRVGELVGVRRGETIFDWRDAVMDGETGRAVTLLGRVLEQSGVTGVKLVMLLGTTLLGVGVTRAAYDRKVRGRALESAAFETMRATRPFGLGPWKEENVRWARWATAWPEPRVRAALRAALDTDRLLKNTTLSDDRGLVADLLLRLAQARAEAA